MTAETLSTILIPLLAATIQSGTPVLYATLGEIITEKSGILNLGVEGIMMLGAFAAFFISLKTGSPSAAFLTGGIAGVLAAALHGIICLIFRGHQVVSGLAITILGTGLANYLGSPFIGKSAPGFTEFPLPFLSAIPVFGQLLFQHDILIYLSFLLPPALWFFLYTTRYGLSLRAAGENPEAARSAGIDVAGCRWAAVLGGGFLIGLGGAYLSLAYTHLWTNSLTAGRGWIAVALVIFSFWRPGRAVFGAYLFGGVMALQLRMQAAGTAVPSSLLLMLPYLLTIVVLVVSSYRQSVSAEPAGLGNNLASEN